MVSVDGFGPLKNIQSFFCRSDIPKVSCQPEKETEVTRVFLMKVGEMADGRQVIGALLGRDGGLHQG